MKEVQIHFTLRDVPEKAQPCSDLLMEYVVESIQQQLGQYHRNLSREHFGTTGST